jgi:hypothetical protein
MNQSIHADVALFDDAESVGKAVAALEIRGLGLAAFTALHPCRRPRRGQGGGAPGRGAAARQPLLAQDR